MRALTWFWHSIVGCYRFEPVFVQHRILWKCTHVDCQLVHVRDLKAKHGRS